MTESIFLKSIIGFSIAVACTGSPVFADEASDGEPQFQIFEESCSTTPYDVFRGCNETSQFGAQAHRCALTSANIECKSAGFNTCIELGATYAVGRVTGGILGCFSHVTVKGTARSETNPN